MVTMNNSTRNISKKRKHRPVKAKGKAPLSVVSVRISDEEKKRIDEIMRRDNIRHYSDVMKIAIQLIGVPGDDGYESAGMFH